MKKILILILSLVITSLMMASNLENIVVLGFDYNDNDSRTFLGNLNEKTIRPLHTATESFNLVMGKEVDKALKTSGISRINSMHADDAGKLGEGLNGSVIVWGSVSKIDNERFRLSGTIRSQRTGAVGRYSVELSKTNKQQRAEALKVDFFEKIYDFARGEITKMIDQARQQMANRLYDTAENQLMRVLEIDSRNVDAYLYLGHIQFEQRKYRDATNYYNKGLEIEPNNEDLLRYISVAYKEQGLIDLSIDALEKVANVREQNGESDINIYYTIASQYKERGRFDEALEALDRALEIDPEHLPCHILYAEITFDLGDYEEAISHLEFITEQDPNDQDSANKLARSYQRTGQLNRAIEKHKANINNNPNNVSAYLSLASAYIAQAQESNSTTETNNLYRTAIQTYLEAQKFAATNPAIDTNIASTYLAIKDLTNAEKYANIAIQKQSSLYDPYIILGLIAQRRGISKDDEFIEFQKAADRGDLYGVELDNVIEKRDQAKRDAHAFFRQADTHFKVALKNADNIRNQSEADQYIRINSEYIERTKPGLFD